MPATSPVMVSLNISMSTADVAPRPAISFNGLSVDDDSHNDNDCKEEDDDAKDTAQATEILPCLATVRRIVKPVES